MKKVIPLLLLAPILLSSCLKQPDTDQLQYNFVVATNTAKDADFNKYNTYYISDSVAYIGGTGNDTIIKNANSQKLVDAVKQNMNARGFTFVAKGAKPDLGLNMGIVKNVSVTVGYPGWWWGYPGWWDPWYWGWYYPYYYPWTVYYSITTGTVLLDMVDVKPVAGQEKLNVVWSAVMSGAVGSDVNTNAQLGVDAINQAFAQSPEVK